MVWLSLKEQHRRVPASVYIHIFSPWRPSLRLGIMGARPSGGNREVEYEGTLAGICIADMSQPYGVMPDVTDDPAQLHPDSLISLKF